MKFRPTDVFMERGKHFIPRNWPLIDKEQVKHAKYHSLCKQKNLLRRFFQYSFKTIKLQSIFNRNGLLCTKLTVRFYFPRDLLL